MSERLPVGSSVLQVSAADADEGNNAQITYSINRRQSDKDALFTIDATSGLLTVNKDLSFERQGVHEIVVVARDGGEVSQETSAFITVRLTASNDLRAPTSVLKTSTAVQSKLKLKYLNGNQVSEFVEIGKPFARLVGIDGFRLGQNDQVELVQGGGVFKIIQDSSGTYLAANKRLDYEAQSTYNVVLKVTDARGVTFETPVNIDITDGNEHVPKFTQNSYSTSLSESINIGSSVISVQASDQDNGKSGEITYSFKYSDSSKLT